MKILRLLITEECNRNCNGCCNKDWDLKSLPVEEDYTPYNVVCLTGGEPMLKPEIIVETVKNIRLSNPLCKIYLYTAQVEDILTAGYMLSITDGITLTLHEQKDVRNFFAFNAYLINYLKNMLHNKSMRLNIFDGIDISWIDISIWKVKENIKWIKNLPLPKNEIFKRLESPAAIE